MKPNPRKYGNSIPLEYIHKNCRVFLFHFPQISIFYLPNITQKFISALNLVNTQPKHDPQR